MNQDDIRLMTMDFIRMGGTQAEAWEATAKTLLDKLDAAEKQTDDLRTAVGDLLSDLHDMIYSRLASIQLKAGFTGMGHNILVEKSGIWQSPSKWSRLTRTVKRIENVTEAIDRSRCRSR